MKIQLNVGQTIERQSKHIIEVTEKDVCDWHVRKYGPATTSDWPGPGDKWQDLIEDYFFEIFHDQESLPDGGRLHEKEPDVVVDSLYSWDDFEVEEVK